MNGFGMEIIYINQAILLDLRWNKNTPIKNQT